MLANPIRNNLFELAAEADATFNRLNRDFGRLMGRGGNGSLAWGTTWASAAMGLWEEEDAFCLELDVPGVKESDIEIEVHENRLTVRVERKAPEGRSFVYNNRTFGRFERTVSLPPTVDGEHISARLADGVLSIRMAKRVEARPRRVSIETQ